MKDCGENDEELQCRNRDGSFEFSRVGLATKNIIPTTTGIEHRQVPGKIDAGVPLWYRVSTPEDGQPFVCRAIDLCT